MLQYDQMKRSHRGLWPQRWRRERMILMSVMEAILQRKSIRAYQDKPIEQEKLEKILEAGRLAPSATNQQAWKFVVVTDPALRHELVAAAGIRPL